MVRLIPALWLASCVIPAELPMLDALPEVSAERPPCAAPKDAWVGRVIDGDTVDLVEGMERIRLLGVDTPEISHGGTPADCWGDAAHEAMDLAVQDRPVTLTYDADCVDLYGRTLAYLWLMEGDFEHMRRDPGLEDAVYRLRPGEGGEALLVNQWLVAQGHATVYAAEVFGKLGYQEALERAEAEARAQRRGQWGACGGG